MGVQELQAIQNAWNNAIESVYRRRQLEQTGAYQQAEIEQRKSDAELRQKEFDAQQAQQQVQNQANAQMLAFQKAQAFQKVVESYETTGILPPGWGTMKAGAGTLPPKGVPGPVGSSTGPMGDPVIGNAATIQSARPYDQVTLSAPPELGGGTIPALTPEAYATRQSDLARIANKAKQEEFAAQEQVLLNNQLKILDTRQGYDKDLAQQKYGYEKSLADQKEQHEDWRTNLTNATHMKIAQMNLEGGLGGPGSGNAGALSYDADGNPVFTPVADDQRIKNIVEGAANGTLTQESFNKQFPNQKLRTAIGNILAQNGVQFVPDKKSQSLNDIGVAASIVPKLQDAYDQMNNHYFSIQFPTSDAYRNFKADKEQIEGMRGQISRMLEGTTRYNQQQANDMADKLIPDLNMWTMLSPGERQAQNQKLGQYVKDLQDATSRAIGNLSPAQQRAITNRLKIPNLQDVLHAPGTQEPTQPGFTPATTGGRQQMPSLDKLGDEDRVTVYDKKTQQPATQKKKYVIANPSRYTILGIPGQGGQ